MAPLTAYVTIANYVIFSLYIDLKASAISGILTNQETIRHNESYEMKALGRLINLGLWLAFIPIVSYANCSIGNGALKAAADRNLTDFVLENFAKSQFECGIRAVELQAALRAKQPGRDGVDGRFALRTLALNIAERTSFPSQMRVQLLKSAATSALDHGQKGETKSFDEDAKFDVLMMMKAGDTFRGQERDIDAWLNTLAAAIRFDQKQPSADRTLKPWLLGSVIPDATEIRMHLDQLTALAQITQGDSPMADFRCTLASMSGVSVWRERDSREVILLRARALLRFTEALEDVKDCRRYGASAGWQWKPLMSAGMAYLRLGMEDEAQPNILRAMTIARAINDANYRLAEYRFVLGELLAAHYDRQVILGLIDEMTTLANTLDTPIAKEIRQSLPQTVKAWRLDRPQ